MAIPDVTKLQCPRGPKSADGADARGRVGGHEDMDPRVRRAKLSEIGSGIRMLHLQPIDLSSTCSVDVHLFISQFIQLTAILSYIATIRILILCEPVRWSQTEQD